MKRSAGIAFLDVLKNIFFTLLFLQALPFLIIGIKNSVEGVFHNKTEVGYISFKDDLADTASYIKRIEEFEENSSIKGVIIKIDSPGGLIGSSQALFHSIVRLKKSKPVVAYVENISVAGAYYAACATTKIVANESALLGGIGYLFKARTVKEFFDSWIINKNTAHAFNAGNNDVAQQVLYDDIYKQCIANVAAQRGLAVELQQLWADGKIFTGNQALQNKLIDVIGVQGDAVDAIAVLLNTNREKIKLIAATQGIAGFMRRFIGGEDPGTGLDIARVARLVLGI